MKKDTIFKFLDNPAKSKKKVTSKDIENSIKSSWSGIGYRCGRCGSNNVERQESFMITCNECNMFYNVEDLRCQTCMSVTIIKTPKKSRVVSLKET